jgi:predicted alpha/beta-fold hydrolase
LTAHGEGYRAPWWLPGGHLQTIVPALARAAQIAYSRERWDTPDGDFIDVDWAGEARAPRLLVHFHGLVGSSRSHYARAIAARAARSGWRVALPHFRGCSGEPNRLARAYHSGDSAEAGWVLERLAASGTPLCAAGVSLGGNVLLKWLGETGTGAARLVRRAAAVSAPLDLAASGNALAHGFNRAVYARHFLVTLRRKALAKLERHPGLADPSRVRAAATLRAFDDAVTAPLHGFRDADDYWARASSRPWLARIALPTLVLNARNDPFLPAAVLDAVAAESRDNPHLTLEFPPGGGHAGFPGRGAWLARRVLDFLRAG